jgi:hypothetical protein
MKARCTRDDKSTNRRGKVGGRNRTTVEVMTGPDRWNKQPMGLAVVAIEWRSIGCGGRSCPEVDIFRNRNKLDLFLLGDGLRRLLLDHFDDFAGITPLFELQYEVFGFHRIAFVVEGDGARDAFKVL